MFKKITTVTALTAALIFGGSLTAEASASDSGQASAQNKIYTKVYYSINGSWNQGSFNDINELFNKYFPNCKTVYTNWNKQQEQPKQEQPKQEQPKQEQPKQEQPKQEQTKQEQPKQVEQKPAPQPPVKQENGSEQQPTNNNQEKSGYTLNQYEQQVVELTNQERAKQGLKPLAINKDLSRVAREKSRDMAVNGYFSHNSPTYGSPFTMMKNWGINYRTAGENIAKGQRTPQQVVTAWMNSDGHRKNILNPNFTEIGVGYIEQGNVWTQQFIGR